MRLMHVLVFRRIFRLVIVCCWSVRTSIDVYLLIGNIDDSSLKLAD